jgi:hypothetical protein
MAATAFVLGFFTALGWWTASKVTKVIDSQPPAIVIQQNKEGK